MANHSSSLPLRLVLQYALTALLLWGMTMYLPDYLIIQGSAAALPTVAALVLLLNIFARPILKIITFPLRLLMTLVAVILVNALFLWILTSVAERFDPATALFLVQGGAGGWIVVAMILGIGNWIFQKIF